MPHDPALDLPLPVPALLRAPFTRADASAAGVNRARFERMLRAGTVVRLLRGVYADPLAERDRDFRAAAVRLAVGPGTVATGRTAAWLHGADVAAFTRPGLPPPAPVPTHRRRAGGVRERDVAEVAGTLVTTPLRTALDLARDDEEAVALAAMDHLLASGTLTTTALLAGLAFGPYDAWVRELAVLADDRSGGAAESALRLQWLRSRLPTPVPGHLVATRGGLMRLGLALPDHRFGVLLRPHGAGSDEIAGLPDLGWWVAVLPTTRVLHGDPESLRRHLEREFHQALLADVG